MPTPQWSGAEPARETYGAADDVVLVGMPADIPHTRVMLRESGHHAARQHVIDWTHRHTVLYTPLQCFWLPLAHVLANTVTHTIFLSPTNTDQHTYTLYILHKQNQTIFLSSTHTHTSPTNDLPSGAAGVDEPLSGGELRGETAAYECVQNTVTPVGHHRGVAGQLVSLQGWVDRR